MSKNSVLSKEELITLLNTNDRAVERALVVLFERQTQVERVAKQTLEHNLRGFCSWDAEIFSSFAYQILDGRRLSQKQLAVCRAIDRRGRSRIGKYHRQLLEAAALKAGIVQQTLAV